MALCMTIIQPIRCFSHPDETSSVVDSPDILCGSGQHTFLLVIAFLAFLLFVCIFFCWYLYSIYIVPVRSLTDEDYAPAIKFIIYRFHCGAWWWGGVFILRAISVASVTLINPSYPYTQTITLALVLLFFLCLQIGAWPWRTHGLNLLDASVTICVLSMVISATSLAANGGQVDRATRERVGKVCLSFWMGAMMIVCCYFCWQLLDFGFNDTFIVRRLFRRGGPRRAAGGGESASIEEASLEEEDGSVLDGKVDQTHEKPLQSLQSVDGTGPPEEQAGRVASTSPREGQHQAKDPSVDGLAQSQSNLRSVSAVSAVSTTSKASTTSKREAARATVVHTADAVVSAEQAVVEQLHFFDRTRRQERRGKRNEMMCNRILGLVEGIETLAPGDSTVQREKVMKFVETLTDIDYTRLDKTLYLFLVDLIPGSLDSVGSFFGNSAAEKAAGYSLLERLRIRRCRGNPDAFYTQQQQLVAVSMARQGILGLHSDHQTFGEVRKRGE